jgi:hypothetical protein
LQYKASIIDIIDCVLQISMHDLKENDSLSIEKVGAIYDPSVSYQQHVDELAMRKSKNLSNIPHVQLLDPSKWRSTPSNLHHSSRHGYGPLTTIGSVYTELQNRFFPALTPGHMEYDR